MMLMLVVGFCSSALAEGTALAEGYYRIMSRKTNLPVHVHNRQLGYVSEQAGAENPNDIDLTRVWKVKLVNGKYWIINVSEGLPRSTAWSDQCHFLRGVQPCRLLHQSSHWHW